LLTFLELTNPREAGILTLLGKRSKQ